MQPVRPAEQATAVPLRPQPLMPRQSASTAFNAVPLVAPSTPVRDEVHINIGRIEVTAVPQPPRRRVRPHARLSAI